MTENEPMGTPRAAAAAAVEQALSTERPPAEDLDEHHHDDAPTRAPLTIVEAPAAQPQVQRQPVSQSPSEAMMAEARKVKTRMLNELRAAIDQQQTALDSASAELGEYENRIDAVMAELQGLYDETMRCCGIMKPAVQAIRDHIKLAGRQKG